MVTVVQEPQGFGQGLAQGLSQTMQPLLQQQFQRSQLQNALQQTKGILNNPNATPQDVALAVMQAGAGIPGSERYLSTLLPLLMNKATGNVTPTLEQIKENQGNTPALPGFLEGTQYQQSPRNIQNQPIKPIQSQQPTEQPTLSPNVEPGQTLTLGNYLPYNIGEQITPEQRGKILDQVRRNNGDVNFAKQQIDEYNQGKISQTDLANKNVDKSFVQQERQFAREEQIKEKLDTQLPKGTDENKKNLYYNMIKPELEKHKDFTTAYQAVQKKIANFNKLEREYIDKIPESGMYGLTKQQEISLRNSAKPLMDIDPLAYNVLETAYTNKGNSIVDVAKTLKPLPAPVQSLMNSAVDSRELIYPKYDVSEQRMMNNIKMAHIEQDRDIPKLTDKLSKIWSEDLSLINMYADLMKKGWFPESIFKIFDSLSDKFGSQQQVERAQLNKTPRIPVRYLTE